GVFSRVPGPHRFVARATELRAQAAIGGGTHGLAYKDPAPGGKLRLVVDLEASKARSIVLKLVAAEATAGWAAGLTIPVPAPRVKLDAGGFTPGAALPGVARAVVPASGPLANGI